MPGRNRRGGPCASCGHPRASHIHDMGVGEDQGVASNDEPGHCRESGCDCQDYGDGVAGDPQGPR